MVPRVYISCPITLGNRIHNFAQGCAAHEWLLKHGYAPLNPVATMVLPFAWQIPHETWMAACVPWVHVADAVIRLPGHSAGADDEVGYALSRGIPVFHDFAALDAHFFPDRWQGSQHERTG